MQRDGVFTVHFSEPVFLPDFIQRRSLMSLSEINVPRDVMDVNLIVYSDVNVNDIQYYLSIIEWTNKKISIHMNFTTPLLISKGLVRDEVYMYIKNPYLFISQATGKPINAK